MAWVLVNKDVSSAITGGLNPVQLEETCKAAEIYKKLTPDILQKIEEILNNKPVADMNAKTFAPFPGRR